ncbi:MAG: hypothetical protein SFW35_03600 [Chitinophagales bacterium]|nr:hypothetical protein [Chitinophagales bacterium]
MKLLLDINDNKAAFLLELLQSYPHVKVKSITPAKAFFLEELNEAVEYLNDVKIGKKQARPIKDLLDEI